MGAPHNFSFRAKALVLMRVCRRQEASRMEKHVHVTRRP
jgi:hypothetical protein